MYFGSGIGRSLGCPIPTASVATSANSKNLADIETDGFANLLEYSLGLNPLVPDAGDAPRVVNEGGYLTMTIIKWPGVTYTVQSAASPDAAAFSAATTTILVNDAMTLKVRDNVQIGSGAKRFMRVRVTVP